MKGGTMFPEEPCNANIQFFMDNQMGNRQLSALEANFKKVLITLPVKAGNVAVNFALENFRKQGFLGHSFQPWRPRKNPNRWGQAPVRNGRSLLVLTGRLRRSVRIFRTDFDGVLVGSDVPYAATHNEGQSLGHIQQVKAHTRSLTTIAKVSSIKSRRSTSKRVHAQSVEVKAHSRKINQNIPARPFLKESPYLTEQLKRMAAAEFLKAYKTTFNG